MLHATSLRRRAALFGLVTLMVVVGSEPAFAQQFQPIATMATNVLKFMTGTFATTVATIMVAVCGFAAFRGSLPWGMAISIVVGIVLIFGGAQIVSSLRGTGSTAQVETQIVVT